MQFLKNNLLPISVFITGACVLIVEIVATRILSPHYGNTIFTVSSVISIILAALSLGYYWGGKIADKHPSKNWFFTIILSSGILLLAFHFLGVLILPALSKNLDLTTGPLITSLILFFPPALLLGTLSPYAVKLQSLQTPKKGVGSISGVIFFWSTLGSIVGSLLAGFILIPNFGIDNIIITNSLVLFALGFIPLFFFNSNKKNLGKALVAFLVFFTLNLLWLSQTRGSYLYQKDGVYEKIAIFDGQIAGRPVRFFFQDRSSSGAMFLDTQNPADLVYNYTKYYALYQIFNPQIKNSLVIGGGAYSIPKALLSELPAANVDVSEIEPSLYELSKEYFQLQDSPKLRNFTDNGRSLLRDSDTTYDLIFSDVYYSLYSIPPHFTTVEFFTLAKNRLSDKGIFIANLIGDLSREQPSLIMSEIKTIKTVFPNSYFFAVDSPKKTGSQNIIAVGYNSDQKIDFNSQDIKENQNSIIRDLPQKIINSERFELSPYPILTDNYSPVEFLTAKVLNRTIKNNSQNGEEILALIKQQLRYGPRYLSAPGHKKVQDFLISELNSTTGNVSTQAWDHKGTDGKNIKLTNIIARTSPFQKNRIIVATHYDSKRLADKDKIHPREPVPGANDSASGVAVLIELARILSGSIINPNLGIDFVFFDGEEGDESQDGDYSNWQPLGSTYFAQNLESLYPDEKPAEAIVLDMVCDRDLKIYKEKASVLHASNQLSRFWEIAAGIDSNIFQNSTISEIRDDHTPLNAAGIPSFLLIDFDYPPYHTTEDTPDKCSAQNLETVTSAVLKYILSKKLVPILN